MTHLDSPDLGCEIALARGILYRFASHCFRHPGPEWITELGSARDGVRLAGETCSEVARSPAALLLALESVLAYECGPAEILAQHARVFGHTPRAAATPYETEWSGAAGELLQYHQIADIAAFYNAFCLELGQGCDERADHVSVELEFLHYLCVKEAWAEEHEREDLARLCRETERKFLAEHLATWAPGLSRRVESMAGNGFYARAARFLRAWIEDECRRLGAACAEAASEPAGTSYLPEDACFSCGHAAACPGELRGATGHVDA